MMANRSGIHVLGLAAVVLVGLVPLFYFVSIEVGIAQAAAGDTSEAVEETTPFDRNIDNVAFGINEKLTFDVNFGFINAGTATMEVVGLIDYEGRPCYQVVTRARSNSFFTPIYKVDDRVESIIDAAGIFSWRFEKVLREGSYRAERLCTFDQRNQQAFYKGDTVKTGPYIQDALSVLYYIRTQELEPGKSFFVENFTDGKLYPLEVKVLGRETVTVEAGTFPCLVVEPLLQSVGVFRHKGKLKVWLTDDRLKMPVLMKSKVLVGSIEAELTDYQLGEIEVF